MSSSQFFHFPFVEPISKHVCNITTNLIPLQRIPKPKSHLQLVYTNRGKCKSRIVPYNEAKTIMLSSHRFITPNWPAPTNVRAYTTTRLGGISKPPWDGFNLADHVGDAVDAVASNRADLMALLDVPAAPCWLHQVHSNTVIDMDTISCLNGKKPLVGDASVAKKTNRVCAILTADCLSVLFCHRLGIGVGAAHAGWRGLLRGVLESTVRALNMNPVDLLVWLGPGIGPGAFEVGDEVYDAFVQDHTESALAFSRGTGTRWSADLYVLARQRLQRLGIQNIYGGNLCTWQDKKRFLALQQN